MRVHKRKCLTSLVFCLQCCYLNKLNAIIAPVEGFLHAQDYEWKRSHYTHIGSVSTLFPSGATFDDLRREYHVPTLNFEPEFLKRAEGTITFDITAQTVRNCLILVRINLSLGDAFITQLNPATLKTSIVIFP